jgi:uncharacterized caspase-like protein
MARRAGEGTSTVFHLKRFAVLVSFLVAAASGAAPQASAEQRIALVIGQGAYEAGVLPTAVNDAGLVAQTLTSAGFEVVQGRDLGSNDLRRIVRDFLDKVQAAEPDASVMVYVAGHGIQFEGENYLIPVDARIARDVDVPLEGFRLSDITRALAAAPGRVRIVVADMSRAFPLPSTGQSLAAGLALMEPPEGFLIAFSSAPNLPVATEPGPYGAYATALVERIREPGLSPDEVFAQVRLRTHEATQGLQTPWHGSNLGQTGFVFFEPVETAAVVERRPRPPRQIDALPAEEAYGVALERDTIEDYQTFLRRYPDHRLARRVTGLLAARREAVVWRQTIVRDTREAYWTYARRYPRGPHIAEARRRLVRLTAPIEPPVVFEEVIYEDLPPPLPIIESVEVVEVVTIIRDAPPPPPPPVYLVPARDYDDELIVTVVSQAPPPPPMVGILPIPVPIPVPVRARPPVAYYQPIAPITPRGPVAIPVAPPPVQTVPVAVPGAPRPRPARPVATVPDQPGLAAPVQPLPVAAVPQGTVREPRAGAPAPAPRIPVRPIPLPGTSPGEPPRPVGTVRDPAAPAPTAPAGTVRDPAAPAAAAPVAPAPAPGVPRAAPPVARPAPEPPAAAAPGGRATVRDPGAPPAVPGAAPPVARPAPEPPAAAAPGGRATVRDPGAPPTPASPTVRDPGAPPTPASPTVRVPGPQDPAAAAPRARVPGEPPAGGAGRARPADEPRVQPGARPRRPADLDEAPRGAPVPGPRTLDVPDAPRAAPGPRSAPDAPRAAPGLERAVPLDRAPRIERPRAAPPVEPTAPRPDRRRAPPQLETAPIERPPAAERPRVRPQFERPPFERARPEPSFERARPEPQFERVRPPPQVERPVFERSGPPVARPPAPQEAVRPARPAPGALQPPPGGPPAGGGEARPRRGRPQGCPPGVACVPGQP